jgi:hypothetical protein
MIKPRRMKWAWYVALTGETIIAKRVSLGKSEG